MRIPTYLTIGQEMCNIELLDIQGLDCGVDKVTDNSGSSVFDSIFCCLEILFCLVHGISGGILGVLRSTLSCAFGAFCGVGSCVFGVVKDTPSEYVVQVE